MPRTQIAAQLYTLRNFTQTTEDFAQAMKRVREIGYEAVQVSGIGKDIDWADVRRICDDNGIVVAATHVSFESLRDDTDRMIEQHEIIGCKYPAIGGLPNEFRGSAEGYAAFAKQANEVGRKLAAAGMAFGYHNHSFELEKYGDRTGLQIIYEESDPKYVTGEIDTYWVQHGGGDPAAWIRMLKGRMFLVHFKDFRIVSGEQRFAEVGEGNLNWPNILEACKTTGVEWYIVEQDNCYDRDPFDSLKISFDNMRAWGLK
ncbi:MAG: sugar phosphate isomerase/epimerase [Armatimonadetes bacterium]|nr:sugar phosphate isomerase/epimerase [Armatimonadota bacterium]